MKKMLIDLKHPRQTIGWDDNNVIRFKENKIINWMLDQGRAGNEFNLNTIALKAHLGEFSIGDATQFWQLLGYSVSGYGDLSLIPAEEVEACDAEAALVCAEGKEEK